jgi:hypothetical protein
LVEEKIPVDFEEDEEPLDGAVATPKSGTGEDVDDPEVKRKQQQFDKQDRIDARKMAIYMNKYAKNCPFGS